MVSITDVAKRAGVSRTTVSHAISGNRVVTEALREQVFKAMRELGYTPSRAARSLALGRTQVLGLLVPDIANTFFAELTKGVEFAAANAGYNVMIGNTGFDQDREQSYLAALRERAVDGFLYAAGSVIEPAVIAEAVRGLPVILVDEEVEGLETPSIVSDNSAGGHLAAEHLLALGHNRAAVITGPRALVSGVHRVEAFSQLWRETTGNQPVLLQGDFTVKGGYAAASHVEDEFRAQAITAVFAANDMMALGAIRRLREVGLKVPDDVSVVGFDDMDFSALSDPALTTIRQDAHAMGAKAAELLIQLLESGDPGVPSSIHLPVHLVTRHSTAPARQE